MRRYVTGSTLVTGLDTTDMATFAGSPQELRWDVFPPGNA